MTLQPGTKLGPYRIVSQLGQGGMGIVYQAHDPQRPKVVPPGFDATVMSPRCVLTIRGTAYGR